MIYKLLNKLFGWDYIQWSNSAASGVARVHVDGMRRVWYWRYKGTKVVDIIEDPAKVIWLTCSPNKYFPPSLPKRTNVDVLSSMKRAHTCIQSITDALGPYRDLAGPQIVIDAYKEARALRDVIKQLEKINR